MLDAGVEDKLAVMQIFLAEILQGQYKTHYLLNETMHDICHKMTPYIG